MSKQFRSFIFWVIIIANIAGAFYGFVFYYGSQLLANNPLLWVFIADCPVFTLAIGISLLLLKYKKSGKANLFYFISVAGALKYGFWTLFVLISFSDFYFRTDALAFQHSLLFIAHTLLIVETLLLIGNISLKKVYFLLVLIFFLLSDFIDYFLGFHPPLPESGIQITSIVTVLMSVTFTSFAYFFFKNKNLKPLINFYAKEKANAAELR